MKRFSRILFIVGVCFFVLALSEAAHDSLLEHAKNENLFSCLNSKNLKELPIVIVPERHSRGENLRLQLSKLVRADKIFLATEGLYASNEKMKEFYLSLQGVDREDVKNYSGLFGIENEGSHVSSGLLIAIKRMDHLRDYMSKMAPSENEQRSTMAQSIAHVFALLNNSETLQGVFNDHKKMLDPEMTKFLEQFQDPKFSLNTFMSTLKPKSDFLDPAYLRAQLLLLARAYIDQRVIKQMSVPANFSQLVDNVFKGSDKEDFYLPINIEWRNSYMLKNLSSAYCKALANKKKSHTSFVVVVGSDHVEGMLKGIQALPLAPTVSVL